jgi:hypothetical protein
LGWGWFGACAVGCGGGSYVPKLSKKQQEDTDSPQANQQARVLPYRPPPTQMPAGESALKRPQATRLYVIMCKYIMRVKHAQTTREVGARASLLLASDESSLRDFLSGLWF